MKRLTLMLAIAVLSGCATQNNEHVSVAPQVVEQKAVMQLEEVPFAKIPVYEKTIRIERSITKTTERVSLNGQPTPVAGWKLPDYGVYRFKLESLVTRTDFGTRAEAFMPEVWLLDKHFTPLQKSPVERMVYSEQSMLSREALSQEFIIDNRKEKPSQPAYLALLTTEEARQYSVKVANVDEEYARIRARTAPPTPPVFAVAADKGTLRLEVTPLISHSRLKTEKKVERPDYVPATPEQVKPRVSQVTLSVTESYLTEVKAAVERADIKTALGLRENARQLHALLQQQFSDTYGQPAKAINVPRKTQATSAKDKLNDQFERQLALEMKREDAQAALAIIDKAGALSRYIDKLF
ncbi:MalM family protein [Endozoicomonas sp.]|uniref:MalM family protein n=1 Tax=Endozoicomonas sp. TaxID=1892382 RepID=UPI003D9BBA0B